MSAPESADNRSNDKVMDIDESEKKDEPMATNEDDKEPEKRDDKQESTNDEQVSASVPCLAMQRVEIFRKLCNTVQRSTFASARRRVHCVRRTGAQKRHHRRQLKKKNFMTHQPINHKGRRRRVIVTRR